MVTDAATEIGFQDADTGMQIRQAIIKHFQPLIESHAELINSVSALVSRMDSEISRFPLSEKFKRQNQINIAQLIIKKAQSLKD